MKETKEALILFSRIPIAGHTKTRLMPFLSGEECAELHSAFLKDIFNTFKNTGRDIFIFHTPDDLDNYIEKHFEGYVEKDIQSGEDLGKKMFNAIDYVLSKGYESCILIGADIPEITISSLEKGFEVLKEKDIVLAPTADDGYYMVGMKKATDAIFTNQHYGSGKVIENAVLAAEKSGLTVGFSDLYVDIDTKEDLKLLYERIESDEYECPNTKKYIDEVIKERLDKLC